MRRTPRALMRSTFGLALAALFTIALTSTAFAHGGEGITITPDTVVPGATVAVTAAGISSPNGDVTITILGNGVNDVLPMQKASDDGDFEGDVTIPSNLVPGAYQLQVAGDKGSLTGDFDVSASSSATQNAAQAAAPVIQPRDRPLSEMILLSAIFGVLAGAGLLFAQTANHRRRTTT